MKTRRKEDEKTRR